MDSLNVQTQTQTQQSTFDVKAYADHIYPLIATYSHSDVCKVLESLYELNPFTCTYDGKGITVHTDFEKTYYETDVFSARSMLEACLFGEKVTQFHSQGWGIPIDHNVKLPANLTDMLQTTTATLKDFSDSVSGSFAKTSDNFESLSKTVMDVVGQFRQKLGKGIPEMLKTLIRMISETLIFALIDTKNFMRTFAKVLASKIIVFCVEYGISHYGLLQKAMNLTQTTRKWTSQGLADFDFSSIFTIKNLSLPFLFTFIFATLYKVFTSSDLPDGTLSELWKNFKSMPKKHKGIISDLKDTLNFYGDVFNLPIGKNAVKQKTEKLLLEITDMMAIKDGLEGTTRESDEISYVFEKAHKAFRLYQDYLSLTKECEKWGLKGESKMLSSVKTQLENLMKHYLAHAKYLQKDRKVPIFIVLRGEPGSGKTQLLNYLTNVFSRLNKPDMKSESRVTDCFSPAQKSEYCDGYYPGTTTWVFDDMGTMVDSATNPDPTFTNLINMVNNAPFPLNMSKAEEKGKIFFDSPFIIASTNQLKWNVKSINNIDALERRTFLDIVVEAAPEYSMEYSNQGFVMTKLDTTLLDRKNLDEGKPAGSYRTDASKLTVRKCGQPLEESEVMSVEEVISLIANEFYSRKYAISTKDSTLALVEQYDEVLKGIESKYRSQGYSSDGDDSEDEFDNFELIPEEKPSLAPFFSDDDEKTNDGFFKLWNETPSVSLPSLQDVNELSSSLLSKAYETIVSVSQTIMDSFSKLWEKVTWKHTLLAMIPLVVLGLGFVAYKYFKKTEAVQRESIFGVYVVDDPQGWTMADGTTHKKLADEMKNNSSKIAGNNLLLHNLTHDAWHILVLHIYAKFDVRCKVGVFRSALQKLKECRNMIRVLSEDVDFEIYENFVVESRTYSTDGKIPKIQIESQTYQKDNKIQQIKLESQTNDSLNVVNLESRSYNKDNLVPKISIEGKSEDIMSECKKLFSQGHVDVTANAILSNRLPSSTGVIEVLNDLKQVRGTMHITMIKGRIGVTASHLLLYGCEYFRVKFINDRIFEFSKDELVLYMDEPKDLLFIEFPDRLNLFKDLTNLFISKLDYKHLLHTKGAMVTYPLANNDDLTRIAFKSGDVTVLHTDYTISTSATIAGKEVEKIRRLDCLMYDINTDFGECGTCIVYMNNALPRKIAGIHIAGQNRSPSGMASIITQEYLKDVFSQCSWKSQISYSLDKVYNFVSTPITEALQDKPCTGVNVLGKIADPPKQITTTNIRKSVIHGVFEPETVPCHLRDYNGIDIFRLNSKKVSLKTRKIETILLDKAIADVKKLVNCGLKEELVKVYDTATAIQGIENLEYVDGVKRQTSPGFPYVRGANGDGKRAWLGYEGDYIQDEDVVELVDLVVEHAKAGERIPNLFVDSLKDERLPKEKVEAGKTRIFSNGDFIHTIAMRKYTLGFAAHLMQNKIENESAVGINVFAEWKDLARFLLRDGKTKFVAGDFSGFDGTLNAQILWGIVEVIEDYYYNATEEDRRVRYTLFADLINSLRVQNGLLYECDHSQPSGNPLTVIINTLYNMIAIRIVYLLCKREAGLPETLNDFRKYVNFVAYGDDNLYGIDDAIVSWFNQHTVTRAFDVIGMVYTDEAKTVDGNIPAYRDFSDVGFLKRKFVKQEGLWMCPIAERTIRELCNWTKKSDDNLQASIDNIEDAFKEAFFHGKSFYNKFTMDVNKAFKEYTVKNGVRANLEILSYNDLLEQHRDRNISNVGILF